MKNLPTALSLPIFLGAVKRTIAYSKHFQYSKQRQNFIYLIASILFNNSCLLNSVQSITSIAKSWLACLSSFLKSNAWDIKILDKISLSLFSKHFKAISYIAIDWTALAKTGKSFDFVGDVYDGRDGKIKNGFPLLLASGITEGKNLILPILSKLTSWSHPEFLARSENVIINNFLADLKELLLCVNKGFSAKVVFLLDAGFYRATILKHLLALKFSFIVNGVENRNIILTDNLTGKKENAQLGNLNEGYYEKVYINHLKRKLNVAVYFDQDKNNKLVKRILISNLENQDWEKMKSAYKHRWAIEEFFKDLKGKYDLENFRVREFKAIERLVKIILIANGLFTDSCLKHGWWIEKMQTLLKTIFNFQLVINKKGINFLREISLILANFGLIDNFCFILKKRIRFCDYVF